MFLFYLICLFLSNRILAINYTDPRVPSLNDLIQLPTNNQSETIAAQFGQDPNWSHVGMSISLSDTDEPVPNNDNIEELVDKPGLIKTGHTYRSPVLHAYPIDPDGVHPRTEHFIFFVRHGKPPESKWTSSIFVVV